MTLDTTFTNRFDGTSRFPSSVDATVDYPPCQRGDATYNFAHRFVSHDDKRSGTPLMFCSACGLVQKIEVLP